MKEKNFEHQQNGRYFLPRANNLSFEQIVDAAVHSTLLYSVTLSLFHSLTILHQLVDKSSDKGDT